EGQVRVKKPGDSDGPVVKTARDRQTVDRGPGMVAAEHAYRRLQRIFREAAPATRVFDRAEWADLPPVADQQMHGCQVANGVILASGCLVAFVNEQHVEGCQRTARERVPQLAQRADNQTLTRRRVRVAFLHAAQPPNGVRQAHVSGGDEGYGSVT